MMQLQLDTEVYNQFYSSKQRHTTEVSDNQFLTILIKHFEKCSTLQDLSNKPVVEENIKNGLKSETCREPLPPTKTPQSVAPVLVTMTTPDIAVNPPVVTSMETDDFSKLPSTISLSADPHKPLPHPSAAEGPALDLRLCSDHLQAQASPSRGFNQKRVCPECKYSSGSLEELSQHFENYHREEGTFPCTCGLSFSQMPSFLRHYIVCPIAATDLPDMDTNEVGGGEDATANASSPPPLLNNETSSSGSELNTQAESPAQGKGLEGDSDKPFNCTHCVKTFKSKALLDQHLHIHYPPRYTCRHCGKKYRWPPVFYHHQRTCKNRAAAKQQHNQHHQPAAATVGDLVSQHLIGSGGQQRTLKAPFGAPLRQVIPQLKTESPSYTMPNQLTCLCGSQFTDFNMYINHINSCQLILRQLSAVTGQSALSITATNKPSLPTLVPVTASLPLPTMPTLTPASPFDHQGQAPASTERNYCDLCNKDFCSRTSLKQHFEGKHSAEAKYSCPGCGKRYRWGASFYYHRKSCPGAEGLQLSENIPERSF